MGWIVSLVLMAVAFYMGWNAGKDHMWSEQQAEGQNEHNNQGIGSCCNKEMYGQRVYPDDRGSYPVRYERERD